MTKRDRAGRKGDRINIEFVTLAVSNGVGEYDTYKIEYLCEAGLIRHGGVDIHKTLSQTQLHTINLCDKTLKPSCSHRQPISAADRVTKYVYSRVCLNK